MVSTEHVEKNLPGHAPEEHGDDHGHGGHDEGHDHHHHHPMYYKFYDIDDHLTKNWTAEEQITVPFSRYGHDPYMWTYDDIYNNMPPLKWLHHKIRKEFGPAADVKDSTLQDFWKNSHRMWLPDWRMFRYDPHAWKFARSLRKRMSLLTAGDGKDDFIHGQLVAHSDHRDNKEEIQNAAEDEMFNCHERTNTHGTNNASAVQPTRLSQILHRYCLFDTWDRLVKRGLIDDIEVDVASHNVLPSWWGLWKWHTAGVAGPIERMKFSTWWKKQVAKREEVLALQQESEAINHLLQDATVFNRSDIGGQAPADFLRRAEKYFDEVLVPRQKELFPQSEFGQDAGSAPITCQKELDRRRDIFFRNHKPTGDYKICLKSIKQWYFHKNHYAESASIRALNNSATACQ